MTVAILAVAFLAVAAVTVWRWRDAGRTVDGDDPFYNDDDGEAGG